MATTNWNEIDNQKIDAEEYLCAFIDILGYKNKAERFFNGKFNLEGRFNRALANATATMGLSASLVDASKLEIRFFSDSIILLLPNSDKSQDQLFSLINFCAILSAHLSFEDLFVRGGISYGPHRESQNDSGASFLASIALQKSYILESRHAKNPRILVDQELVARIVESNYFLLAKESDDYFVHFAPHIINSEGQNTTEVLKEMQDIKEAREQAPDPEAKEKYTWILDYYYWTLSLISGLNMNIFETFAPQPQRIFSLA
jgi:hypothetical protein